MEYVFNDDELQTCKVFADNVDTSFYAKRNQFNNEKRKKDALIGKLGEFAVWNLLKDKYTNLSLPDTKIYSSKEKSWDFDLKATDVNLHVKTQDLEQGQKYGLSWIFQYGDGKSFRSYDKEIFDKVSPNQYVAFVSLDLKNNKALVQAITSLNFLHDKNLWAAPKLDKLKFANKLAIYLSDLQKYPEDLNVL